MIRTGKCVKKLAAALILCGFAALQMGCEESVSKASIRAIPDQDNLQNINVGASTQLNALWLDEIDTQGNHSFRIEFQMSNPIFFNSQRVFDEFGEEVWASFLSSFNFPLLAESRNDPWKSSFFQLSVDQAKQLPSQTWTLTTPSGADLLTQDLYFPEALSDLSKKIALDDSSGARTLSNCAEAGLNAPLKWSASNATSSLTKIFIRMSRIGSSSQAYEVGPIQDTGIWESGLLNGSVAEALLSAQEIESAITSGLPLIDEIEVSILRQYVPPAVELKTSPRSQLQLVVEMQESKKMTFIFDGDCHP